MKCNEHDKLAIRDIERRKGGCSWEVVQRTWCTKCDWKSESRFPYFPGASEPTPKSEYITALEGVAAAAKAMVESDYTISEEMNAALEQLYRPSQACSSHTEPMPNCPLCKVSK